MKANWFLALPVPAVGWFASLPPPPAGIRAFAPSDLHLTIAFLGTVREEAARAAWAAFVWPLPPAVDVTLGPVVPMGRPERFSALSALLAEGRHRVEAAMSASRDAAYHAAGVEPDARPAKAHITVARPQRKATPGQREHALAWASSLALPQVTLRLEAPALYTWSEDRSRALFRIVEPRTG
jgi:2'-5' RNA ligase